MLYRQCTYWQNECPMIFKYWAVNNAFRPTKVMAQLYQVQRIMKALGFKNCEQNIIDSSDNWGPHVFAEVKKE